MDRFDDLQVFGSFRKAYYTHIFNRIAKMNECVIVPEPSFISVCIHRATSFRLLR